MRSDVFPTSGPALSPRAGIALLKLELRAAVHEADAADVGDAGREQLRERLGSLIQDRQRTLDAAVAEARFEAEETVVAAQRAAAVMVAMASSRLNGSPGSLLHFPPPVGQPVENIAIEQPVENIAAMIVTPDTVVTDLGNVAAPFAEATTPPLALSTRAEPGQLSQIQPINNVIIDAEAFAKVFATVVAAMLDERTSTLGMRMAVAPAPAFVPREQSFWSHARHPDVLLLGLTTVIVLVVLAAWLG